MAHHDVDKRVMYIRKDAFRRWCDDRYENGVRTMGDLQRTRAIVAMDKKFAIGTGTPYATARSICFVVDMTHPDVAAAGVTPKVVQFPSQQAKGATK